MIGADHGGEHKSFPQLLLLAFGGASITTDGEEGIEKESK
jgi:hypothetical protein